MVDGGREEVCGLIQSDGLRWNWYISLHSLSQTKQLVRRALTLASVLPPPLHARQISAASSTTDFPTLRDDAPYK